jgi:Gas vesicle synthesis protein GvpL/GvpF
VTLLLYAIGRELETPTTPGVRGAPLRLIGERELAAVTSELDGPPEPTEGLLWEYEQVVEGLIAAAILPARFGSVFADEAGVREMLSGQREAMLAGLRQLGGAVEFAVSVGWGEDEPAPADPAQSGTAYMLGRLERQRRAQAVASRLGPLDGVARSSRKRVLPRATLPVTSAYLVDRERSGEFTELVARLGEELDDIELVCTGPWPPYTFAQGAPV